MKANECVWHVPKWVLCASVWAIDRHNYYYLSMQCGNSAYCISSSSCNRKCNLCDERCVSILLAAHMPRTRSIFHFIVTVWMQAFNITKQINCSTFSLSLFWFYRLRECPHSCARLTQWNVCVWRKSFDFDFTQHVSGSAVALINCTYWFSHTRASLSRFSKVLHSKVFIPLANVIAWTQ